MEITYDLLRDIGRLLSPGHKIPCGQVTSFVLKVPEFRKGMGLSYYQEHDPVIFNEVVVKLTKVYQIPWEKVFKALMGVYLEVESSANMARDIFLKIPFEDLPLYLNHAETQDVYGIETSAYAALSLKDLISLRLNKYCYEK